jgi:transcription elongation factor Elf1
MSLFVDKSYVTFLANKLDKFSQKSEFLWKFRCPICGDSKKNKSKTRGYIYRKGDRDALSFQCHNCGESSTFKKFLEKVDPGLYQQYKFETFADKKSVFDTNLQTPTLSEKTERLNRITLPKIADLPDDHFAKQFLINRKIPTQFLSDLYYAEDFKAFTNEMLPDNHYELIENDKRIVIPFYDKDKKLVGVQGRAILSSPIKYATVKFVDDAIKVWGLDRVDYTKPIYVVEGPFDAMFLDNGIATMDSSLHRIVPMLGSHDYRLVFDNEPRNAQIVHKMKESIKYGLKICIWPSNVEAKDINEMILAGQSGAVVQSIIDKHTHDDMRATLELSTWTRI